MQERSTSRREPSYIRFTQRRIDALPIPVKGRAYHYDENVPALAVCVTQAGTKTFYVYRRIHGKPERVRLGRWPQMGLEQARRRALEVNAAIADGKSPQQERRLARAEMTLGELFADYLQHHAKAHKRTWREDEKQFKRYLAKWENRRISEVARADVAKLHTNIGGGTKGRPYAANRMLALISAVYGYAIKNGYDGRNPARGVQRFKEQSRERFLQPEEMPRFFAAIEEEPSRTMRDFFKMLVFTGARRGNVGSMQWSELDLRRALWTIPAGKAKAKKDIRIPLMPDAVDILRERRELVPDDCPWIFPSPRKCAKGHLTDPMRAWRELCERADLPDLRPHDLRRTVGSWLAATGASELVVGKAIGDTDPQSVRVYGRLNLDPVRAAMEKATGAMKAAAKKKSEKK